MKRKKSKIVIAQFIITCLIFTIALSFGELSPPKENNFKQSAKGLYYFFWCEGEDHLIAERQIFKEEFGLNDLEMEALAQLAADYQIQSSDLFYSTQNQIQQLEHQDKTNNANAFEVSAQRTQIDAHYSLEAAALLDAYCLNVSRQVKDTDKFTSWMRKFQQRENAIQEQKNQGYRSLYSFL